MDDLTPEEKKSILIKIAICVVLLIVIIIVGILL